MDYFFRISFLLSYKLELTRAEKTNLVIPFNGEILPYLGLCRIKTKCAGKTFYSAFVLFIFSHKKHTNVKLFDSLVMDITLKPPSVQLRSALNYNKVREQNSRLFDQNENKELHL